MGSSLASDGLCNVANGDDVILLSFAHSTIAELMSGLDTDKLQLPGRARLARRGARKGGWPKLPMTHLGRAQTNSITSTTC